MAVTLARAYPAAKTINLVLDNLNIRKILAEVFGAAMAAEIKDLFTVHYTPTHDSRLNQTQIAIGISRGSVWGNDEFPV